MEGAASRPQVMVVDDDPQTLDLVQEILDLIPCRVLTAYDGQEALQRIRSEIEAGRSVDVVLLDVVLPGVDGFHVLAQVKSDPDLEQIPVILVTGVGAIRDKTRGLQMGADDYVTKPFDPQELLARVNVVLRIRRTEQMLRRRNQELAALNEINQMVSASLELDRVLASALRGLERLVEADALAVVLRDDEADEWMVRTARTPEGTWLEGRVVPVDGNAAGEALRREAPLVQTGISDGFWAETLGMTPLDLLHIPLVVYDEPLGLLVVLGRADALNQDHLPLLEHIAATVSIAVENARLYGELAAFAEALEKSQSQLIQAEKMAAVGRLAASIAHEINNPLQAVQNSLHLARHPGVDEPGRRHYLGMAQQEVQRLVHIVRRMLDFYRPASTTLSTLDVNQAVRDALQIAGKRFQQARIRTETRLAPNLPPVWGSSNQLTQVFLNIVINAIEAMEEGGELTVGSAYHAERRQVVAAFRDSGPGMSAETREHLFEPFFTTKSDGTGLGLAISYGILEQHGGVIEVENPPDGGTTFIVRLPVHATDEEEEAG